METILKGDAHKYFRDLFLVESTITFKSHHNHKSQRKELHKILQLPVMDGKENILLSLHKILKNYFQQQSVVRNCHTCDNRIGKKSEITTTYPLVLLQQYKCFTKEEYKTANQIICGTSLKLYNAT